MTTDSMTDAKKLPKALRYVLALLAFSVFINYIDRGNLSIAAPMLKDELGMSASQLGVLLSSFFWTYSLFLILSGWLVDRVSVSWVMAIGFFLWSAATSVTGFLHGFTALLVVRLVLGIGESVAYPAYSKILAKYFPASQRASANSIIASGLACGPAFGMLLGGVLMSRFGWRSFFVVLGSISLVWLLPWFRWMPRGPGIAAEMQLGPEPTTLEILKQRSAWGTFLGLFCSRLLTLLPGCMAAVLPGSREAFLDGRNGENWRRRVSHASRVFDCIRTDRRSLDRRWGHSNQSTHDFHDCRIAWHWRMPPR